MQTTCQRALAPLPYVRKRPRRMREPAQKDCVPNREMCMFVSARFQLHQPRSRCGSSSRRGRRRHRGSCRAGRQWWQRTRRRCRRGGERRRWRGWQQCRHVRHRHAAGPAGGEPGLRTRHLLGSRGGLCLEVGVCPGACDAMRACVPAQGDPRNWSQRLNRPAPSLYSSSFDLPDGQWRALLTSVHAT